MFIKLNKISERPDGQKYLVEVRLNTTHILSISENIQMSQDLTEGKILKGLSPLAKFSDISLMTIQGSETITVIGEPEIIESKIVLSNKRQLLRG